MGALFAIVVLCILFCTTSAFDFIVPPRDVSFASLDTPTLQPRVVPFNPTGANTTWAITASCCGYGPFSEDAVQNASAHYGLFDFPCGWPDMPFVGEWGYEFHNNQGGIFPTCGNLTMAGYRTPPTDRDDALHRLALYWACRAADARNSTHAKPSAAAFSMIGHYFYAGLSASFNNGPVIPGSEIGENINSINAHLAFSRGAARQFAAPFIIDFSAWMSGYITDYSTARFWGSASSPVGGHSLSLFRRAYFATFMSGAGALIAEAGAVNYFYQNVTAEGVFDLSPVGKIGADLYAISHGSEPEAVRGIPYVPLAIVTEQPLGMGLGWWYQGKAWDTFALTDAELRTSEWLQQLWPGSFNVQSQIHTPASETYYMVAGANGDTADVLLPSNLTAATLIEGYRVAVLAGLNAQMDEGLAQVVVVYVTQGGAVILNADEITTAAAQGWLSAAFLGLQLHAPARVDASLVTDTQTGWTARPTVRPFCVEATPTSFYIKTGGDPDVTSGWDGGTVDKCCSTSPRDCMWFGTHAACVAALLASTANANCRTCGPDDSDVGCPSWAAADGRASMPLALYGTTLTGASSLLEFTLGDGTTATGASINRVGAGTVTVLLAPAALGMGRAGFGIVRHLLDRIANDTQPVVVTSNATGPNGGLQLLLNRVPAGWNLTLVNNNGVVKQPESAQTVDPSQARTATIVLRPGYGTLREAWATDGSRPAQPVAIGPGNSVTVTVAAGALQLVGLVLA